MIADVLCKYGEDAVVVLKEGAGRIDKLEVVDEFGSICVGIRDTGFLVDNLTSWVFNDSIRILLGGGIILRLGNPFGALSEKDGGTTSVLTEVVGHAFPLALVTSTDGICANGAVFNVNSKSGAFFHEAD